MPADRAQGSTITYNAAADPRRRPPGSAPPPAASSAPQQPVASTSALPARPAPSTPARKVPYVRPSNSNRIRCQGACGRDLDPSRFSEQQHRNKRKSPLGDKAVMCEDCAPRQQHSMKCAECEAVKSADSFAIRQRSNPSSATCRACQTKITARNAQKRSKNDAYGSDIEDDSDSDAEEERAKAVATKDDPYQQAEEDEDPWELYR